jgi:hypothetical protein
MNTPTIVKFSHYLPTYLWRWNRQSVPKLRHIKFRRRGITHKKAYSIQNTAKVWNQVLFVFCLCNDRPTRYTLVFLISVKVSSCPDPCMGVRATLTSLLPWTNTDISNTLLSHNTGLLISATSVLSAIIGFERNTSPHIQGRKRYPFVALSSWLLLCPFL